MSWEDVLRASQPWADTVRSTHLDISTAPESDTSYEVGDASSAVGDALSSDADAAAGGLRAPKDVHRVVKHSHHDRKLGRDVQLDLPKPGLGTQVGSSVAQKELVQLKQRLNNAEVLGSHAMRAIDRMAQQNKALRRFPVACPSCGTLNAPPGMAWGEGDVAECQGCHQSFVPLGNALHEDDLTLLRSAVQQMKVQNERANYWEAASRSSPGLRRDSLKQSPNRSGSPQKATAMKERRKPSNDSASPSSPSRRGSLRASAEEKRKEVPFATSSKNHPSHLDGSSKALAPSPSSLSSSSSGHRGHLQLQQEAEGKPREKNLLSLMNTTDFDTQSSCESPSWRGHGAWGKFTGGSKGRQDQANGEHLETWKQVFANAVGSRERCAPRNLGSFGVLKEEGEISEITSEDGETTSEATSSRFSTWNLEPSTMAQAFALPETPRNNAPAGIVPSVCLDPPLNMPRHRSHQHAFPQQHFNNRAKSKDVDRRYGPKGATSPRPVPASSRPLVSPRPAPPASTVASHRSLKAIRLLIPGCMAVVLRVILGFIAAMVDIGTNPSAVASLMSALILGGCVCHTMTIVRSSLDWGQKMETSKGDWRRSELHLGPCCYPGPGLSLEEALGAAYGLAQLAVTFFFEMWTVHFQSRWGLIAAHVVAIIGLVGSLHWYLVCRVFHGSGGGIVWAFAATGNAVALSVALFSWWPLTLAPVSLEDTERCTAPTEDFKVDPAIIAMTILHGVNLWMAKRTHQPSLQCFCTLFAALTMAGWCIIGPHVGTGSTVAVFGVFCLSTGGFLWQQLIGSL